MDLQQLRCFVAAVELRSISDAAKVLDVSQPAVTRSLQNLEHSVETTLLERTSRGVTPTPAGQVFYEHARGILSQVERSVSALARLKGEAPMTVVVGTTPSFVDHLLPTVLTRFMTAWPQARIVIRKALLPELRVMLEHGEIDIAFAINLDAQNVKGVVTEELLPARIVFLVGRGHPLRGVTRVSPAELIEHKWALLDSADVHSVFRSLFDAFGLTAPEPVIRANSMRLLKSLAGDGDVIIFLPHFMVSEELASGELAALPFAEKQSAMSACLLLRNARMRPEVAAMADIARQAAREFTASGETRGVDSNSGQAA